MVLGAFVGVRVVLEGHFTADGVWVGTVFDKYALIFLHTGEKIKAIRRVYSPRIKVASSNGIIAWYGELDRTHPHPAY